MIGDLPEGESPAGRSARTTYLSELLAPVERLDDAPPDADPEARLAALSWAFALIAVAALVVCGLIVSDAVRAEPLSSSARPAPEACAGPLPCSGPNQR